MAGIKVLALDVYALVVIDVVLPAVLGLVHVGEAGVGAGGDKLEGLGDKLLTIFFRHDELFSSRTRRSGE